MKEFIARLTWVDYAFAFALLRGLYVGYKTGLFPELLRNVGYLVIVIVTFRFHEPLAQYVTLMTFLNDASSSAISLTLLILGTFLATKIAARILLKLLKIGNGGFFYRLTGAVLGAARWAVLFSLLFMLIDHLPLASLQADIHKRSLVGPEVSQAAPLLFDFMSSVSPQLGVPKK